MNEEAIAAIKKEMGYKDGSECCKVCQHFVPTDCSGAHTAKRSHCTINIFDIPVDATGWCKHGTFVKS